MDEPIDARPRPPETTQIKVSRREIARLQRRIQQLRAFADDLPEGVEGDFDELEHQLREAVNAIRDADPSEYRELPRRKRRRRPLVVAAELPGLVEAARAIDAEHAPEYMDDGEEYYEPFLADPDER